MRWLIPCALLLALPTFADVTIINVTNNVTAYNEASGACSAPSTDTIRLNVQSTDGVTNQNFAAGGGHTFAIYLYSLNDAPKWLVYSNANDAAAVADLALGQVRFEIIPPGAGVYELYAEAIPVNDPAQRYPIAWHTLTVTNAPGTQISSALNIYNPNTTVTQDVSNLLTLQDISDNGATTTNIITVGGIVYSSTYWDDLTISALNLRDPPGGIGAPELIAYSPNPAQTNYVLQFDELEEAHGQVQMSHRYAMGTDIEPHIHWTATTGSTNVWALHMQYGRIGRLLTNNYSSIVTGIVDRANEHTLTGFATVLGVESNMGPSGIFLFRVQHVDAVGASPDPILLDVDWHFQISNPGGSDDEIPTDI